MPILKKNEGSSLSDPGSVEDFSSTFEGSKPWWSVSSPQIRIGGTKWDPGPKWPNEPWLIWLVVEPTHLKNISQIGSFPQIGVKIKNVWNHHLVIHGGEITNYLRSSYGMILQAFWD